MRSLWHPRIAALVALSIAWAPAVGAQTAAPIPAPDAARVHFDRGVALLNAQNFDGALAEFERSYSLSPRQSVLLNIGVALQSLHRYPEAAAVIERFLRESPNLSPERRAELQSGLTQMRGMIAHLQLVVHPAGAAVRVDGALIGTAPVAAPVAVGPGHHTIEVVVGGNVAAREEVVVASGDVREVRIGAAETITSRAELPPEPAPARLTITGAPANATATLDGHPVDVARPIESPAGRHRLEVAAPGHAAWRGEATLAPGAARVATVHLADTSGWQPRYFYAGVIATVALGAASAVLGVLTLNTRAQFVELYEDDPTWMQVAARGEGFRTGTNVLLGVTGIAAAATVLAFTQTRFGHAESSVQFAIAPTVGGAAAGVRLRF